MQDENPVSPVQGDDNSNDQAQGENQDQAASQETPETPPSEGEEQVQA